MNTRTKTIKISYDNFEDAIISFLYSIGVLNDNEEVVGTDFGIEVEDDDTIEFDVEVVEVKGN